MANLLKYLAFLTGLTCLAIGIYHLAVGADSVFGGGEITASTDSQERFFAGLFAVYGLAWILVARQRPISATWVRLLAAALLAGGVGRVISLADRGRPDSFWIAMLIVELVVPAFFFAIATADEKAQANEPSAITR